MGARDALDGDHLSPAHFAGDASFGGIPTAFELDVVEINQEAAAADLLDIGLIVEIDIMVT